MTPSLAERYDVPILVQLCELAARSPDQSSQNCACLFDPKTSSLIKPHLNCMPRDLHDRPELWERPGKYDRVVHAETGALMEAARAGIATQGLWMYAVWASCGPCAALIIEAGITRLITLESSRPATGWPGSANQWADSIQIGHDMMVEAGIEIIYVPHPVMPEGFTLLRGGKEFRP
jgi:deoxycytidylate deaminase